MATKVATPHPLRGSSPRGGAFRRGQDPSLQYQFIRGFWPRRGQCGKREKSVKKNAALLHFLGFFSLTLLFGVLRGEQPFGRGCGVAQRSKPQWGFEPHERASSAGWRPSFWPPSALPRNSGTFFATFFGHKKGSLAGGCRYKEVPPQGGGTERHQPTKRTCKLAEPWVTLYRSTMVKFDSNQE